MSISMSTGRRFAMAVAVIACAAPLFASAQAWPTRPITLINPYAAGGPADALARALATHLQSQLKTTVIVDNKAGGGATIGTGYVARAKPDGYTLLISTSAGHVVTPLMQKIPYDGVADFDFIGVVANQPNVLVANPALGVTSVSQLIALAKKSPGTLNYASAGAGGATHLGGVVFQQRAGIRITHVPYSGASPALKDVLGGQVQLAMLNLSGVLPFVKDGKLNALAYASHHRSPLLPDVPTLAEAGLKDAEFSTWYTLSAPHGTPTPILQQLSAALNTTLADKDFRQFLLSLGAERVMLTPSETRAFVEKDKAQMRVLLQSMGQLAHE